MAHKPKKSQRELAGMTEQLASLQTMTTGELRAKYREVYGEPSRSNNKDYLRRKIAWRIQELAEGGLSERAGKRINELSAVLPMGWRKRLAPRGQAPQQGREATGEPAQRDARLPAPGTVLTRVHQGIEHKVTVLAQGFEYRDQQFTSLSKIAREITGTPWNGYLFFGLKRRRRTQA